MRTDAIYWALAREHAASIFGRADAPEIRALAETDANPTSLITTIVNRCAVISISGALEKETWIGSRTGVLYILGYDLIRQALAEALANPLVASILLSIDSPGGIVQGAKELADYIAEAGKVKPVAAYADGLCASAAYWLAAATSQIYAPATALVGSVGVIMRFANFAGYYTKLGVQIEYLTSGKFKAAGNDTKELSEEERSYFESQLAELHRIFSADVQKSMAIAADRSLWAEAQLMPATQARELGLVSQIVADQAEAVSLLANQVKRESFMDLNQLKAEQPDLVAALKTEWETEKSQVAANQTSETLALVKAIAGEETAAKIEALQKAGITSAQFASLAPMFAAAPAKDSEAETRQRILAELQAQANPVPSAPEATHKSRLVADAERRCAR